MMSGFRDTKLKTPLTTRWAQMSKQEQIIERKKVEIQAKLEAQKQAAALAAQAKLVSGNSKDEGKTNIFRNDGSFMNQFKALLEKQKQQKAEEERVKFEAVEKENRAKAEALEKHKLEGLSQEDSLDIGQNIDHESNQQSSEKERSEESQQSSRTGEVDNPEFQDKKHIPSLMQIPMMPPQPSTDENNQNMQSGPPNIPPFMTGLLPNFQAPMPGQPPFLGSNVAGSNVAGSNMGPPDFATNSSGPGFGPNGPSASFGSNNSGPNFGSNGSHGFSPNAPGPGFGPNGPGPGFGPNGPGFGHNGPGFGPNGPGSGFGPNGPGPGFGPNGPGPGFGPNGPGSGFRPNGPGQCFGPNFRGPMGSNGPPFFAPFPNRPPFNGGPNMPPFPPSRGPHFNGGPNGPPFNSGPPFMGGPNMPFNGPNNAFNMGSNRQQFNNFNSNRPPFNASNNRPPFDDISQFDSGEESFSGPPRAGSIGSQQTCQMPNVPTSNNAPNFMPPSSMCLNNIPEPKPLDSVKIPPPNPMSMQNIPPPLPVTQRPSTKELNYESNRQSASQDMDADIAARDAARHWRNTGRLPDLRQYSALWFINDVTSTEYRKFRELIEKYKNAPDEDSRELKSEDKYDPEFSLEDDDSNDDYKNSFNTNESNNCFKEDKFAVNKSFKQENYDSNDSYKNDIYNSYENSKKDNYDSNDSCKNNNSDRSLPGGNHFNYKEETSSQDGNKVFEDAKNMKREYASSQSDEEEENKKERRRKKKSRWGDTAADVPPVVTLPTMEVPSMESMPPMPPMPPMPEMLSVPGMPPVPAMPPVPTLPPVPAMPPMPPMPPMPSKRCMPPMPKTEPIQLTSVNRTNPALVQYAITNYGTTNLSPEDWKKCEDNFKLNLLYQDMMKKRQELERLAAAGKFKYEYDSDEDTDNGTWEHKLRAKEMNATERWATELTKQATGKHHIGDFLPPEELKKFMEKYSAAKGGDEPNLSDYKEYKLKEDNVGFKMLQKLGWTEGKGLGAAGTGIVEPVNKAAQPVANAGLGAVSADNVSADDDEFDAYRKRMMLAYRFRPNPLNNPRRPYY